MDVTSLLITSMNNNKTTSLQDSSDEDQKEIPLANQLAQEDQKPAAKSTKSDVKASKSSDRAEIMEQVQNALKKMPFQETEALNSAWEQAPHMFQAGGESDPLHFLQVCDNNAEAAAKRLAVYWKHRDALFGDRKYLPMNQTGQGALSADDLKVLGTGFVAPIFEAKNDTVWLCFDRSRLDKFMYADESRLRCIFYIMATVARQENDSGRHQWGAIRVMQSSFRFNVKKVVSLLEETFPVRFTEVHFVCLAPPGALRTMRQEMKPIMEASIQDAELKTKTFWHMEASPAAVCAQMQKHGVSANRVPVELGGQWSHNDFHKWLAETLKQEQGKLEDQMKIGSPGASSPRKVAPECLDVKPAAVADVTSVGHATGATATHLIDLAMEQLEDSVKAEYLEAKRRSPQVVEKESNPAQFLSFSKQDAGAAARQLAAYWKKRISLFGDKGYLMIDQTGEGALGRGDMTLLSGGFLVLLPEGDTGHPVICYDGSRLTKAAKNCQLRVAFYWLKLVAEHPESHTEGFVILHLIDKLVTNTRDKRQCIGDILSVFPIRIKEVHGIPMESIRANDKSIGFAVKKLFGKIPTGKVISYANVPQESITETLLKHGISNSVAPKAIGGSWGYEDFVKWQELRTRYEWDLPPGPGNKDALHLFDFSNVKRLGDMNEEEKVERKRRMNVLHSRRKRERERIEIEVLQEQCAEYEHKNRLLSHDNLRMENLMESARRKIARIEDDRASVAGLAAQSVPSSLTSLGIAAAPLSLGAPAHTIRSSGLEAITGGTTTPGLEALLLQQIQQQRLEEENSALRRMQLRHAAERQQLQQRLLLHQQQQQQQPPLGTLADSLATSLRQQSADPFLGMQQDPFAAAMAPQLLAPQPAPEDGIAAQLLARQRLASMLAMQHPPSDQSPFDTNRGPL